MRASFSETLVSFSSLGALVPKLYEDTEIDRHSHLTAGHSVSLQGPSVSHRETLAGFRWRVQSI